MRVVIRDATDADVPFMTDVLNREIAESPYVYAEQPVTRLERGAWLASHQSAGLPVLIAHDPADPAHAVGWAALSPYRSASGYRLTTELSVYVLPGAHRRGIGSTLVAALHDAARALKLHAIVASVDADNAGSIRLFERFGYVEAARLPEVGRKFNRWRTQLLLLRTLED